MKTLWLALSLCDDTGQSVPGIAIELLAFSVHGLHGRDIIVDLTHLDQEEERITLRAVPGYADITAFFRLGTLDAFVAGFALSGAYPPVYVLDKQAFRARCGVGRLLNSLGHFVEV